MKKHVLGILFLIICCTNYLAAQVDTEFWFAAPHISEHSRVTGEYHIILFAYDQSAHVVISMPANSSFVNKEYDLPPYGYVDVIMASDYDDATANFDVPLDVVSQRGIYISSTAKIGGYYQHAGRNSEAFSFKENAVGTDFLVTSQITHVTPNDGAYVNAYSSIQIVATENNTTVTITPAYGHQLGLSCNASPVVVNLNRGETYAIRTCNKDPQYGVNGTRITSNKGITVTTIDDSTQPDYPNSTGADLMGDQIVPITLAGTEYVVIGQLRNWNECFVTAIENGTTVNLGNGSSFTLQKNETRTISMSTIKALYISSNKPIIVYQLTGKENEAAGTVLPKLACTGSPYAVYKKLPNSYSAFLNIVIRAADIGKIYINDNHIASSNFHSIAGTTDWYYAAIDISSYSSDVIRIKSLGGLFQLGALDMIGVSMDDLASCSYGYFSDYGTAHEYDEYDTFEEGTIYTWLNHFLSGTTTPMTFSTEGVYRDTLSDSNGCDSICILHLTKIPYPDNVVDIECVVPPMPSSFEMVELFKCDSVQPMTTPFVVDIDGDGITEIISAKWPEERKLFASDGFVVIDGRNGKAKYTISTVQYPVCGQPVAIADVNNDGKGEIILLDADNYAYCYSYNGTLLWKSTFALDARYTPLLCDFNHDGLPELVFGKYILNPVSGTLLLEINYTTYGKGWSAPHGVSSKPTEKLLKGYYMCALADIDGDGTPEVCAGNTIYSISLVNYSGTSGNSSNVLRQAENISDVQEYDGQTIVVDFDNDGDLDICVLGLSHDMALTFPNPTVSVYIWDGQSSSIIAHTQFLSTGSEVNDNTWTGPSIPYCGDLDGDNLPEITFAIKSMGMMSYKYDPTATNHILQVHNHPAFAETCGFTVFDFNKDGKSEIVYRDAYSLSIADGTTLNHLCTPVVAYSGTITEYPVVADVNGDGSAEIIINRLLYNWDDRTGVRDDVRGWTSVYGSSVSGTWSSARPIWNQWVYTSTCINNDLTVPRYMYNVATQFPNGKKPYNTFLSQVPIIDQQGDIFVPAADAAVKSCSNTIQNDSVEITINFCNNGDANLVAPFEVTTYKNAYREDVIKVDTVYQTLSIGGCTSLLTKIPVADLCSNKAIQQLLVAINDDGHGIAQHGNQQAECDTTNNTAIVTLPIDFRSDTTKYTPVICAAELPYTFTPTGTIFPVGATSGRTIIQETNQYGCDSIITIDITVNPTLTGDTTATFCNGTPFIWHGTSYAAGGDYPYTYTSKVAPYCDSIVTLHLTQLEPTDSVEVVTICAGDSHTWHGNTYTTSTTITETIDNAVGCDSVCTLQLTVLPAFTGDTNMTVCDTLLPVVWRGQSVTGAGEYYHTATASNGCDSTITLYVTVETCVPPTPPTPPACDTLKATLLVPDICADDDSMYIDITYTKGMPVSYTVTFGADAVAQGFQSSYTGNVRITSGTAAFISIPIPNDPTDRQVYPKPNVYSIDISILDTCDVYTAWRSQDFMIHYPSWLTLQRWNDVISLYNERYNGGYVFSQIRWFHEGALIESRGEHNGYIYQRPTLVYGDAYWAELTRADDGVTITTCPIYPVPMTDSTNMDNVKDPYIIVTPTIVSVADPYVDVKTNICGKYDVYYVDGRLLDEQPFCPQPGETFKIDMGPYYVRAGLYILVFNGEEGTIKAVKLLLEP